MVLSRPMGREVSAVFAVNVVFTQISLWKRHNSLRRLGQKAYQILLTHGTAKKRRRGFSAGFAAYAVFKGVGSRFASVASRSTVMNRAIAVGRKCELGARFL